MLLGKGEQTGPIFQRLGVVGVGQGAGLGRAGFAVYIIFVGFCMYHLGLCDIAHHVIAIDLVIIAAFAQHSDLCAVFQLTDGLTAAVCLQVHHGGVGLIS